MQSITFFVLCVPCYVFHEFVSYKTFLEETAREAGAVLKKEFLKSTPGRVMLKSKHEIVTAADLAAEKIILRAIKKRFPDHEILSEESGSKKTGSDYLWVIDPLDGTTNFSIKHPLFSTTFALVHKKEVIASVVYAPMLQEMYIAEQGKGVTLNGKRMHVSTGGRIGQSILTYCYTHSVASHKSVTKLFSYFKTRTRNFRHLGCASLELAFTAAGRVDGFLVVDGKPWDMAAGALMVKEARGKISDFQGEEWTIKSKGIIASNASLHASLVRVSGNIKI